MSAGPESEVRIVRVREGGFLVWRGEMSPEPAKAASTLSEVLDYVGEIMAPADEEDGPAFEGTVAPCPSEPIATVVHWPNLGCSD